MPAKVICEHCGDEFSVDPYRVRNGTARYCGNACRARAKALPYLGEEWAARFWAKVDREGPVPAHRPELGPCWEWQGWRDLYGYGMTSGAGKDQRAHRASWEMANGPIPEGMDICHRCDNPACVRPSHFFLGTAADNLRDMAEKGRASHTGAKITPAIADEIRRRYAAGALQQDLATAYGIAQPTVSEIVNRVSWKHFT